MIPTSTETRSNNHGSMNNSHYGMNSNEETQQRQLDSLLFKQKDTSFHRAYYISSKWTTKIAFYEIHQPKSPRPETPSVSSLLILSYQR